MTSDEMRDPGASTGSGTVLVVDDSPELRVVLTRTLERAGFRVIEAGDGEEALTVVQENAGGIDVVLADVVMPRMGGRELIWRLNEMAPDLPVILLSGVLRGRETMTHLEAVPAAFIEKPFDLHEVVSTVRRLVGPRGE